MTRVLAIDDEVDILTIIEGVLLANGHEIVVSTDPRKAVPLALEHRVEAIVLDVNMPDLSGFETLEVLRAHPQTAGIPILFLSALGDAEHKIRGLRRGADDYLAKPFAGDELVLRIERFTQRLPGANAGLGSLPEDVEAALKTGDFQSTPVQFGRYRALEILGRGGMGVVLRAHDPILKREVALKTLNLEKLSLGVMSLKDFVSQLMQEATALARFNHRNIVAVYDVGLGPGNAYIVMELVEGVHLMNVVNSGCLTTDQAIHLSREVARALATAHEHEILHRDLKPGNVLVSFEGEVKVTDFGLADKVSALAEEAEIHGTPGFVPPEVLLGESYSLASDLFGLGATLYLTLTGEPAFAGKTLPKLLSNTLTANPIPPCEINPEIPGVLSTLVLQLLDPEPGARPTAAQVEELLTDLLPGDVEWSPECIRRCAADDRSQLLTVPATVIDSRMLSC